MYQGRLDTSRQNETALMVVTDTEVKPATWIVDSGASSHISGDRDLFSTLTCLDPPKVVLFGNNANATAHLCGTVIVPRCEAPPLVLENVLYVPGTAANLLAPCLLTGDEGEVSLRVSGPSYIYDGDGNWICDLTYEKPHWVLQASYESPTISEIREETCLLLQHAIKTDPVLWHRRFAHVSYSTLGKMAKQDSVYGIEASAKDFANHDFCEACVLGKLDRSPFGTSTTPITAPLEQIAIDLSNGPTESLNGSKYVMLITDYHTRYMFVYFLKRKSEAFGKFVEFYNLVTNQFPYRVKRILTDNGGEFTSNEFNMFCNTHGIKHNQTVPYNPEQNGLVEKYIHVLHEDYVTLLSPTKLSNTFWAEALSTACYVRNRTACTHAFPLTPFELFHGYKPDVSHLRVFGCVAYAHIPKEKRVKGDRKSFKCIFIGYTDDKKGYRLYDPRTEDIIAARSVWFAENHFDIHAINLDDDKIDYSDITQSEIPKIRLSLRIPKNIVATTLGQLSSTDLSLGEVASTSVHSPPGSVNQDASISKHTPGPQPAEIALYAPSSTQTDSQPLSTADEIPAPALSSESAHMVALLAIDPEPDLKRAKIDWIRNPDLPPHEPIIPQTIAEALTLPEAHHWIAAAESEYQSMISFAAWDLVSRPRGVNIVPCRWLFTIKHLPSGIIDRFKARLVAKGYNQREGEDYYADELYAPTTKYVTLRILLTLAVTYDLEVHQLDVKTAFLNGYLKEKIFMEQPPGFVHPDHPDDVCELKRSLYGLKQAPRAWYERISEFFISIGFEPCIDEPTVFINKSSPWFIAILIYVDDILIFGQRLIDVDLIKSKLAAEFVLTDKREIAYFLGLEVQRNREEGTIFINQKVLAEEIVAMAKLEDANTAPSPLEPGLCLKPNATRQSDPHYRSLVGKLLYLSISTRPDIAYAVSYLSRFTAYHNKSHTQALKHLVRYVKGTIDCGILIKLPTDGTKDKLVLHGFTDSDYANESDRKSVFAYLHYLNGNLVSWTSKKHSCVASSTGEAEYIALSESTKNMIIIRKFLWELELSVKPQIYCDNKAALAIAQNNCSGSHKSKHIDVRHHMIKDCVEKGVIAVSYVRSEETPADALTKSLQVNKFIFHQGKIIAHPPVKVTEPRGVSS